MAKLKRVFVLWAQYARMDLQFLLQDPKYGLLCIASDCLSTVSGIAGVFLLAIRFGGVSGLSADEILLMLGICTMVTGMFNLFFAGCNTGHISRRIGRGQIDHMLIQPLPLPLQLITEGFLPFTGSGVLVGGVAVFAVATARLHLTVTLPWLGLTALLVLCALAIQLGLSYLLAASAFYHPAGSEEISTMAIDAINTLGGYPLSGAAPVLQGLLTTVLPAGCMAWLPGLILLGKVPALTTLFPVVLACLLCGTATLLFKKGLKHYAKFGSQRYRSMGHRS